MFVSYINASYMHEKVENQFVTIGYVHSVFRCKWVKVDGYEYKPKTVVILDVEDDLPMVGIIQEIHVSCNNKVIFTVEQFSTIYMPHYRVYILETSASCTKTVCCSNLFIPIPIHLRTSHVHELTNSFVILPYALISA